MPPRVDKYCWAAGCCRVEFTERHPEVRTMFLRQMGYCESAKSSRAHCVWFSLSGGDRYRWTSFSHRFGVIFCALVKLREKAEVSPCFPYQIRNSHVLGLTLSHAARAPSSLPRSLRLTHGHIRTWSIQLPRM